MKATQKPARRRKAEWRTPAPMVPLDPEGSPEYRAAFLVSRIGADLVNLAGLGEAIRDEDVERLRELTTSVLAGLRPRHPVDLIELAQALDRLASPRKRGRGFRG